MRALGDDARAKLALIDGYPVTGAERLTWVRVLRDAGVEVVRTAFHAPNMNAFAERWVRSVKSECLDRLILLGHERLEHALAEYVAHYNAERPHQGLDNELIDGDNACEVGDIVERERLGGLLRYYHRAA